jgi:mRNA interferase MazF
VNRGEVWWAESPAARRRPYLVLTRQAAIPVRNAVIAVPATRAIRDIPTEVPLDEGDGMPSPCALSLDNVVTLPKSFLIDRICRLGPDRLIQVCTALATATGCR